MEFSDLKFPDNLKLFTTDELRNRYQLLLEELTSRREEVYDTIRDDIKNIIKTVHDEGYKLQIVDYCDDNKRIEIRSSIQFDIYDPIIESSEI